VTADCYKFGIALFVRQRRTITYEKSVVAKVFLRGFPVGIHARRRSLMRFLRQTRKRSVSSRGLARTSSAGLAVLSQVKIDRRASQGSGAECSQDFPNFPIGGESSQRRLGKTNPNKPNETTQKTFVATWK
jgi:hypothetical protein